MYYRVKYTLLSVSFRRPTHRPFVSRVRLLNSIEGSSHFQVYFFRLVLRREMNEKRKAVEVKAKISLRVKIEFREVIKKFSSLDLI